MKLLFILPEYVTNPGGGIVTFYRHFLPLLAEQGHTVRVIVGSGVLAQRTPSRVMIDGVSVEMLDRDLMDRYYARFAHHAALPGLRRYLAGAWAMWEQADRGEGFDVVEAADWGLLFLPWVVAEGPPVVAQLHGSIGQIDLHDPVRGEEVQGNLIRLLEAKGLGSASCLQAYSLANADVWQRQTGRVVDSIRPAWTPMRVGTEAIANRSARGLVVGRVQHWKGPEVLCQAQRLLGRHAPQIDWVGRDMFYQSRDIATSDHLRKNWAEVWGKSVSHLPQQPYEQITLLQARAAFVVVPSLWDTFNFTCVEAMAAGTPVICSNGAGASELIEDGANGFVFDNGKAMSLASAMERLLAMGDAARKELGESGRQTVLRELDPVRISGLRIAAYKKLAYANRAPAFSKDDWTRLACEPGEGRSKSTLSFLDHHPLRPIVGYVNQRLVRKLTR